MGIGAFLLLISHIAYANLIINEVDYDNPGADLQEFIELLYTGNEPFPVKNIEVQLIDLSGNVSISYSLENLDPSNPDILNSGEIIGLVGPNISIPENIRTISLGGSYKLSNGTAGIRIFDTATQEVLDSLSYEGIIENSTENGQTPTDSGEFSIGRCKSGLIYDTNQGHLDFLTQSPSFGKVNSCPQLVINEVNAGLSLWFSLEFIEIKNIGTKQADLNDVTLCFINELGECHYSIQLTDYLEPESFLVFGTKIVRYMVDPNINTPVILRSL